MAQNMIGAMVDISFVNSRRANGNADNTGFADPLDYLSPNVLRPALNTFDPFTYTSAVLDTMSVNDMVFAIRNIQDPTTIANYITAQIARVA